MDAPVAEHWPEELVPSQWLDRLSPALTDVPERRLLLAVLVDAIRCLQGANDRERKEVVAWVHSEHANARLSFRWVCDGLGLELVPLGRRLLVLAAIGTTPVGHRRVQSSRTLRIGSRKRPPRVVETPICDEPVPVLGS
jgi:hypothetical protein